MQTDDLQTGTCCGSHLDCLLLELRVTSGGFLTAVAMSTHQVIIRNQWPGHGLQISYFELPRACPVHVAFMVRP